MLPTGVRAAVGAIAALLLVGLVAAPAASIPASTWEQLLPDPVSDVRATVVDNAVTLTWTAAQTGPAPSDYRISISRPWWEYWEVVPDGVSTATEATVELGRGVAYVVRVQALTAAGHSTGVDVQVELEPLASLPVPTDIGATPRPGSPSVLDVTWTTGASTATITDHILEYRLPGAGTWISRQNGSGQRTSNSLHFLTPDTAYEVRVRAVSYRDVGIPSAVATVRTAPLPDAPTAVHQSGADLTTVTLAWTAPTTVGFVDGYELRYRDVSSSEWYTRSSMPAWTTLTDLQPSTTYEVTVRSGWFPNLGPSTEPLLVRTADVPETGPPFGPRAQFVTSGDHTGDGRADVYTVDATGRLHLWPGGGDGTMGSPVFVSRWAASTLLAPGDWDGDRRADLLSRDGAGYLYLHAGDGRGGFASRARIGRGWAGFRITTAGDVNGDGRQDLLAIDTSHRLWLYPGNGKGGWLPRVQVGRGWNGVTLYAAGDMTRDGRVDVLGSGGGLLHFYPGRGNGSFGASTQVGRGWGGGGGLASGADLNRDGVGDLLSRTIYGDMYFHAGKDSGSFERAVKVASGW